MLFELALLAQKSALDLSIEYISMIRFSIFLLTHLFPMYPFSTPWKHKETLRFSDVFRV